MKVRIMKGGQNGWYSNYIGEVFEVEEDSSSRAFYVVTRGSLTGYYVQGADCKIVKEESEDFPAVVYSRVITLSKENAAELAKILILEGYNVQTSKVAEGYKVKYIKQ